MDQWFQCGFANNCGMAVPRRGSLALSHGGDAMCVLFVVVLIVIFELCKGVPLR